MVIQWLYVWNKLLKEYCAIYKGFFINLETQDSSISINDMSKKVMNHLQSTMMEMILSKPIFASTIPKVYPQLIPIFYSLKIFP